jgi:tetratricopeptide (TPR) repeat protein
MQASPSGVTLDSELAAVGQWFHRDNSTTAQHHIDGKVSAAINPSPQVAVCGSCHSRRSLIVEPPQQPQTVQDFHNNYQLQLLDEGQYYADGQIQDEVFVLGSFLQSKMFHRGVTCANCHQPHSLQLKAEGNAVCTQCHQPAVYDVPAHHHHPVGTGSQCVNCHMPETTYMVVDPRRDHSLRIPRPDLSDKLGSPNACVQCHSDKSNSWATTALQQWLKQSDKTLPRHYGEALAAARAGQPQSDSQLLQLIANTEMPAIVRATALTILPSLAMDQRVIDQARRQLQDADPLVRSAAVQLFAALPVEQRADDLFALLSDPVRSVSLAAAAQLVDLLNPAAPVTLTSAQRSQLQTAAEAYRDSLEVVADTPNGQLNIGLFETASGDLPAAEAAYRQAIKLDAHHLGARLNLADLLRGLGRDGEGRQLLEQAIKLAPQVAAAHHSLGLLLIRQRQYPAAELSLQRAAELDPANSRYGYVYAVALNSLGKPQQALSELQRLLQQQPGNAELLNFALQITIKQQRWQEALLHAQTLLSLNPLDSGLQGLVQQLRQRLAN